jgi:hypothetical protein
MKLTAISILGALALAGAAQAQPQGGGGGLSPEVHAAREAVAKACAADARTLCQDKQGREMMMCLRDNAPKLSQPCQEAMAKMPPRPMRPQ